MIYKAFSHMIFNEDVSLKSFMYYTQHLLIDTLIYRCIDTQFAV